MKAKCEQCGEHPVVHFEWAQPGSDARGRARIHHFCEPCGRKFAATVPPQELISYCADLRPGDTQVQEVRQFCVVGENPQRHAFRIAEMKGQIRSPREWAVPAGLVPEDERYSGGEFSLRGNALELEIFMTWFRC